MKVVPQSPSIRVRVREYVKGEMVDKPYTARIVAWEVDEQEDGLLHAVLWPRDSSIAIPTRTGHFEIEHIPDMP